MKQAAIKVLIVIAVITGLSFFMLRMYEVPNPSGWTSDTKRYYNPILGFVKIVDARTNETIFFEHSEPTIFPEEIEKVSDEEWRVTFKRRPSTANTNK